MITSTDPTYPLYPTFAFLGFLLSIIPLPWHIQAWNSGTCAFMLWTAVACLNSFVNSIVWAGNLRNPAPVWCDISSKLVIGVSVGIPAAVLCISRRLYYITSGNVVSITRDDKRRMVFVDLGIAVGMPVIIMTLHYIVQGHRFDILEDVGCYPVVYNTLPAYFLYFMWTPIFGCISFTFSAMTLRSFWIRRAQFNQLITSNSSMSISRYMRLVLLALIDIMCTLPLGIYSIYIGNKGVTLAPWISWSDTHFNFSRVGLVPSVIWRSNPAYRISLELSQWLPVICAILFFALFGFADEARKHYKLAFWFMMKLVGVKPTPVKKAQPLKGFSWNKPKDTAGTNSSLTASLPPYVHKAQSSPTSFQNTIKKFERSNSLSTCVSTNVAGDFELGTYKYASADIDLEKSAGISPGLSDSDAATLYGQPPVYHVRPQPDYVPQDVKHPDDELVFMPTPASLASGHFAAQQMAFPPPPPSLQTPVLASSSSLPDTLHLPKMKTSNSSMRTIHSPDRDRFYVYPTPSSRDVSTEATLFPSSPPPFAAAVEATPSQPEARARHTIEVMVHKTETTTTSGTL